MYACPISQLGLNIASARIYLIFKALCKLTLLITATLESNFVITVIQTPCSGHSGRPNVSDQRPWISPVLRDGVVAITGLIHGPLHRLVGHLFV